MGLEDRFSVERADAGDVSGGKTAASEGLAHWADVEIDAESDPEHLVLASKAGVHRVPRWDTNALVDGLGKMVNSMVGPGSKTWGLSVVGDEDA